MVADCRAKAVARSEARHGEEQAGGRQTVLVRSSVRVTVRET